MKEFQKLVTIIILIAIYPNFSFRCSIFFSFGKNNLNLSEIVRMLKIEKCKIDFTHSAHTRVKSDNGWLSWKAKIDLKREIWKFGL